MKELYEYLNIPENCRMRSRVALGQIYQAGDFKTAEQKDIAKQISKIYLIGEINSKNFNIKAYKDEEHIYETIQFVYIELLHNNQIEWLDEILHKLFPNPVVLIYNFNDNIAISVGLKRLNKIENDKIVVQESYNTFFNIDDDFYNAFSKIIKESKNLDLYRLYIKIYKLVFMQNIYKLIEKKECRLDFDEVKKSYDKIKDTEKQNVQYNLQLKSERNESKKMELFMIIKKNEIVIKENIEKIGG